MVEITDSYFSARNPLYKSYLVHCELKFPGGEAIDRATASRVAAIILSHKCERVVEMAPKGGAISQILLSANPDIEVELVSSYITDPSSALFDAVLVDPRYIVTSRAFHLVQQNPTVFNVRLADAYVISGYLSDIDFRVNSLLASKIGRVVIWHSLDDYKRKILGEIENELDSDLLKLSDFDIYVLEWQDCSTSQAMK